MDSMDKLQKFLPIKGEIKEHQKGDKFYCILKLNDEEDTTYRGKGPTKNQARNACWNQIEFVIKKKQEKLQQSLEKLKTTTGASKESIVKATDALKQFNKHLGYMVE